MKRMICDSALWLMAAAAFFLPLPSIGAEHEEEPPRAESQAQRPDYGPGTERATLDAARRYADIAASGGWPRIAEPLGPESSAKAIAALRRRLAIEGYLTRDEQEEGDGEWDDALDAALRRFQKNNGLEETGQVTRDTLRQLDTPPAARARALAATAARLAKMRFRFGDRYVAVNIPATAVEAVQEQETVARYGAIVGGKRDRSPQIAARIVSIDVNPTWTAPASIIRKELLPKLRRNPNALARQHIRIFDGRGREVDPAKLRRLPAARAARFTFRQDPGPTNALGSLRLSMPNKNAVFMHDTPHKELFDKEFRFLSHGCVRVEGVYRLAAWLLDPDGRKWDEAALRDEVDEGRTEKIKLLQPVPVAWVYMTGWAADDGPARFRRDIYNLDKRARMPARGGGLASR